MSTQNQIGLKVGGALSGVVFVDSLDVEVSILRREVARLLGLPSGQGIKLIVSGRSLADDTKPLHACGIAPSSRLLVVAGAAASGATQLQQAEAKQAQLDKIKRVLSRLAARDAGADDNYSFVIENQSGQKLQLKEEDRRAIAMGMALHDMGKTAMGKGEYDEALSLLFTAEESFGLADPGFLQSVDNLGMLLLDIVWCCYKSGDARRLAVARERLRGARAALERAYGQGLQRLRTLHGSRCPELAIYCRLEALEAVSAYHCGDLAACEQCLQSAQARWSALQVSDLMLAQLQDMGYDLPEARRALKLSGGDMDAALTFIAKQRQQAQDRRQRRRQEAAYREERKLYGRTPDGMYVDAERLDRLVSLGYGRELAAFSLRLHGNNLDGALEDLLDERTRALVVQALSVMQSVAQEPAASTGGASSSSRPAVAPALRPKQLLRAKAAREIASVIAALKQSNLPDDDTQVLSQLHGCIRALAAPRPPSERLPHLGSSSAAAGSSTSMQTDAYHEEDEEDEDGGGELRPTGSDAELEEEVRAALQSDAMASYDIDVTEEGEIISTFGALCASNRAAAGAGQGKGQ